MSGAACMINGKFHGMVHRAGTYYNVENRCVAFTSSSFIKGLAAVLGDSISATNKDKDDL